jgi:hypothetical protein
MQIWFIGCYTVYCCYLQVHTPPLFVVTPVYVMKFLRDLGYFCIPLGNKDNCKITKNTRIRTGFLRMQVTTVRPVFTPTLCLFIYLLTLYVVFLVFSFLGWGETESTWYVGLLYQPRMIYDECGEVSGMRTGRGNQSTRRKSAPMPFCPT